MVGGAFLALQLAGRVVGVVRGVFQHVLGWMCFGTKERLAPHTTTMFPLMVRIFFGLRFWVVALFAVGFSCNAQSDRGEPSERGDFFSTWFERVSRIQAQQPAWMTPVFTTTPRLDEELHYDQSFQSIPGGRQINFGNTKGLELIPYYNFQLNIGIPSYITTTTTPRKSGWSDETFLLKYRFLAGNETNGNYVLTAFMGLSVPSGSANYSSHHYIYTPTIAGGKGWGDFDIQSTLGVALPDSLGKESGPGTPLIFNTSLQYKIAKVVWPDVEFNYTYWPNGVHENKQQLFVSPGLIFGRFPIWKRLRVVAGIGYQVAVTSRPLYHNNFDITVRFPF